MRGDVSVTRRVHCLKGGSVLFVLLAGLSSGCSTDALRFGQDGFYNSAVPTERNVDTVSTGSVNGRVDYRAAGLRGPVRPEQGVDGSASTASQPVYAAPSASQNGYSSSSAPVYDRRQLPAASGSNRVVSAPLLAPPSSGSDGISTGSVQRPPSAAASGPSAPANGNGVGQGVRVTLSQGETLFSLSRQYGVSVADIQAANNITDVSSVRAGQTILVPARSQAGNTQTRPGATVAASPVAEKASESLPPKPAAEGQYQVVAGDTLASIARRAQTSVSALKAANRMSDDTIRIGQTLKLPGREVASTAPSTSTPSTDPIATGPVTKKAEENGTKTLGTYQKPKQAEAETVASLGDAKASAPKATGVSKLRWPAKGRVTRDFGSGNTGIDIAVPMGTPVKAAENGVVVYAGSGLKDLGNTVLIQHDDGTTTVYGNASELSVKKGDKVARGQQVARAGTTGNASAPQVHFEVRKNSNPVDPKKWLE